MTAWLAASAFVAITHPLESVRADAMSVIERADARQARANNARTFNEPHSKEYDVPSSRQVTLSNNGIIENVMRLPQLSPALAPAYFRRVQRRQERLARSLQEKG